MPLAVCIFYCPSITLTEKYCKSHFRVLYCYRIYQVQLYRMLFTKGVCRVKYEEISALVCDESTDIVYISDLDTYEMYYLSKTGIDALAAGGVHDWRGLKCYAALQGRDSPCEFCTNHLLSADKYYEWEYYNPILDGYYSLKDKLINLEGKEVRMEIASDITKRVLLAKQVEQKLSEQTALNRCVEMLNSSLSPSEAVDNLLSIVADFYSAERAYIFDLTDGPDGGTVNNTHEWCAEGITPHIDDLQNIPYKEVERWFETFDKRGVFFITRLGDEVDKDSFEYQTLEMQGIESLMAAPLVGPAGQYLGFIGVDNPKNNFKMSDMIVAVSRFVVDFFEKSDLIGRLNKLSFFDILTGLRNRHSYRILLDQYERTPPRTLGILYADINGLREINDSLGHKAGDAVVQSLAHKIAQVFGGRTYRIGGDEFVAMYENIGEQDFEELVAKLRLSISEDDNLQVALSSTWNQYGDNSENNVPYTQSHYSIGSNFSIGSKNQTYTAMLSQNLCRDISEGRFTIYFQPQVDLKNGEIIGAEALIRRLETNGTIQPPADFIPFYEKEGIIPHIDYFVFEQVCRSIADFAAPSFNNKLRFSVNLSRLTVFDEDVVAKLSAICEKYAVSPGQIAVEITETMRSMDNEMMTKIISDFRACGFFLSLDDFGSGYSNLAVIAGSDFDEIKIDKSLTDGVLHSDKLRTITKLAIDMCTSLGDVVSLAEGIETAEQRDLLCRLNCTIGQGYYFDKPMPIEQFKQKYIL